MSDVLKRGQRYLCHCGIETDLIFNHGVDLPEFSLYPLVETEDGCATLARYADDLIATATSAGLGTILETATWMANADRAAALGYDGPVLDRVNRAAVALMKESAAQAEGHVLVSANVGPRADAYAPDVQMSVEEAQGYHRDQIVSVTEAGADIVSGYTLAYVAEAAGIALAAREAGAVPVISFTVETNGALPDGTTLRAAIEETDRITNAAAEYYMINCAHPDHFDEVLAGAMHTGRLKGLVVNASRASHAELDEAEELDAGDPPELALLLAAQAQVHPELQVFGGCCGTDHRHIAEMANALSGNS